MEPAVVVPIGVRRVRAGRLEAVSDYLALTRPRLTAMVVATGLGGYLLEAAAPETGALAGLLAGLWLTVAGANAANQVLERDADARMVRTLARPLAGQRLWVPGAAIFAGILLLLGILLLASVSTYSALLALAGVLLYAFSYTPLKRVTPLSLYVGAVPGALPPLIGAAAAAGEPTWGGAVLALLLFGWQVPHFLAISWLHRDDYGRAGFKTLAVRDPSGAASAARATAWTLALLVGCGVSGVAGWLPAVPALVTGCAALLLLRAAVSFQASPTAASARRLLATSYRFVALALAGVVLLRIQVPW